LDCNKCLVDLEEIAEAYAMGTLPMESAVAFEDHYFVCARCAAVLQEAAEYVEALRGAAGRTRRGNQTKPTKVRPYVPPAVSP
jgi:exonuclease VII small subunit